MRPERLLVGAGGVALLASLFCSWSHQLSSQTLTRFARSPLLVGVPQDPTGWQVYSAADIAYAVLVLLLLVAALTGSRAVLAAAMVPTALAVVFVIHALSVPPSNGVAALLHRAIGAPDYASLRPSAGPGETVALAGLAVALLGLAVGMGRSGRA